MKTLVQRLMLPFALAAMIFAPTAALSNNHGDRIFGYYFGFNKGTVLDVLQRTDGAQALVAAVIVVDGAGVLDFSIAELLDSKSNNLTVLAPSNAAFEKLLGLNEGDLNGLSIDDIVDALPGLLPVGVGAEEVAAVLLKHVAVKPRYYFYRGTEDALLKKGEIEVADGSVFPVGVGASGVQINYETTITKPDNSAKNGIIQFIDTVIVDGLL